nr:hypothetical protein [Tanacetum cinerariifolium]
EEEEYDDEFNVEEKEKFNDEETMYDYEDDELTNEFTIASLMDTIVHHEIKSATTVPLPPSFFNPLQQEVTPTTTPTTSEATTSLTSLLDFTSLFKFNERLTNLEKDLSEIKRRSIAVTRLKIMKMYGYGHLEEIEVRRDNRDLYTFKEGEYSQWVERLMNYLEEQMNGEAMINSIKNGDQPLPRVTQVSIAGTSSTEQPPLKDKSIWSDQEKRI